LAFTIALTIGFASSDRLAGAYGTAVPTTMLLSTVLLYRVMRERWRWWAPAALAVGCTKRLRKRAGSKPRSHFILK
jgi:KUP system potassium uptake protein